MRFRQLLGRVLETESNNTTEPSIEGNFLYIALQELKDLEHQFQLEAESLGIQRSFPQINPANVHGVEINPYAAELARVAIWVGQIQWMRRNGFTEERDPILKPIETIECRDAILAVSLDDDGEPVATEPDWPEADAIIGNPPFLGGKKLREFLGDEYVDQMFGIYVGRVSSRSGPRVLLVRQSLPSDQGRENLLRRTCRHELHPRGTQPEVTPNGDQGLANLQRMG